MYNKTPLMFNLGICVHDLCHSIHDESLHNLRLLNTLALKTCFCFDFSAYMSDHSLQNSSIQIPPDTS